jgi:hypothetical protein
MAHELGHAFGLAHDFRNDNNFDGNLMGNGLRGWRGPAYPELYPNDDVQLSYAAALALNSSRYFNADQAAADEVRPALFVSTSGSVALTEGKLQIDFLAIDASGLSAALLLRNGEVIGEMPLDGTALNTSFQTPYFTSNQSDTFAVKVYDAYGNMQSNTVTITPQGGVNVAPQPFLSLSKSIVSPGESISLSAANTFDPNHSSARLLYEWDLTGDGVFTSPSSKNNLLTSFETAGTRLVSVRVTDPAGAWAVSAPLAIRVVPEPSTFALACVGAVVALTYARRRRRGEVLDELT